MIEVQEAVRIIAKTKLELPAIKIPLEKAVGRVLRQSVSADADFPPFNRVMMDGIAIRMVDFENRIKDFSITGIQAAGSPQMKLSNAGECLEVMTGAVAPEGADAVIPYEDIQVNQEAHCATVNVDSVKSGMNIHARGTDKKKGDVLLEAGILIDAPEISIAASVGLTELQVTQLPRVAIISTGNELVDISEQPLPHQIRRSNVHGIAAELRKLGIKSTMYHFNDEKENLKESLRQVIDEHQLVILSGGVSKGKFDFVPETLQELGIQKLFHRVKQKPGKPFWFGAKGNEKVVFAFPGNPVSTFVCFHKYLIPWLKDSLSLSKHRIYKAVLAEDFSIKTKLGYFLQVRTQIDGEGRLLAYPEVGRGSGDHANLLSCDSFLELPPDTFQFKKGEVFNLIPFRNT